MKRYKRYLIVFCILLGLINAPLPYDVIQPGTVRALDKVIEVKDRESPGGLYMVTAKINHATPYQMIQSWSDPYARIIPKLEFDQKEESRKMTESKGIAERLAFEVTNNPTLPVDYTVDHVGGPSAGLMMALETIQQINEESLSQGFKIAGTGTVDPWGEVGEVGAIPFKLVAADREKIDIFFYPIDNVEEVQSFLETYTTKMKLVPVQTVYDALDYLRRDGNA